jgi:hypothetical protein
VPSKESSQVTAQDRAFVKASGSAIVLLVDRGGAEASGNSTIHATGTSNRIHAKEVSRVIAGNGAEVLAQDSATVTISGNGSVEAKGGATIESSGNTRITVTDVVSVTASESSTVTAFKNASVTATDNCRVEATDSVVVRAHESVHVKLRGKAEGVLRDSSYGEAFDDTKLTLLGFSSARRFGRSMITASQEATVLAAQQSSRIRLKDNARLAEIKGLESIWHYKPNTPAAE